MHRLGAPLHTRKTAAAASEGTADDGGYDTATNATRSLRTTDVDMSVRGSRGLWCKMTAPIRKGPDVAGFDTATHVEGPSYDRPVAFNEAPPASDRQAKGRRVRPHVA